MSQRQSERGSQLLQRRRSTRRESSRAYTCVSEPNRSKFILSMSRTSAHRWKKTGPRSDLRRPGIWDGGQLLSWQAHFLEEFDESRVVAQNFQQWIGLDLGQPGVALRVSMVQPFK